MTGLIYCPQAPSGGTMAATFWTSWEVSPCPREPSSQQEPLRTQAQTLPDLTQSYFSCTTTLPFPEAWIYLLRPAEPWALLRLQLTMSSNCPGQGTSCKLLLFQSWQHSFCCPVPKVIVPCTLPSFMVIYGGQMSWPPLLHHGPKAKSILKL
jgi:hypothetical protein